MGILGLNFCIKWIKRCFAWSGTGTKGAECNRQKVYKFLFELGTLSHVESLVVEKEQKNKNKKKLVLDTADHPCARTAS